MRKPRSHIPGITCISLSFSVLEWESHSCHIKSTPGPWQSTKWHYISYSGMSFGSRSFLIRLFPGQSFSYTLCSLDNSHIGGPSYKKKKRERERAIGWWVDSQYQPLVCIEHIMISLLFSLNTLPWFENLATWQSGLINMLLGK